MDVFLQLRCDKRIFVKQKQPQFFNLTKLYYRSLDVFAVFVMIAHNADGRQQHTRHYRIGIETTVVWRSGCAKRARVANLRSRL